MQYRLVAAFIRRLFVKIAEIISMRSESANSLSRCQCSLARLIKLSITI